MIPRRANSSSSLVQQVREQAGLTQVALAERAGLTQSAIARLESPSANPTIDTLANVLAATGHRLELTAVPQPPSSDETQLVERLSLSPAERLALFTASQRGLRRMLAGARRLDG
jgi:transcriptional regulator with XRE-family HTH domain